MKSLILKASVAAALVVGVGFNAPVVNAAPVAVQPTVAVVDANHAAIVAANGLLNAFLQTHPGASITEIAFEGEDGIIKYEVEGFDTTGKYELKYVYNTNQITDTKEGEYNASLATKAFDPQRILPPADVVNFAYAQAKGQATSLNDWSVKVERNKPIYKVEFGTPEHKEITVRVDAITGELLSVKGLK